MHHEHISTGRPSWDRVLAGGCVASSSLLLSGEPGIGKTTALTAVAAKVAEGLRGEALYVSAEMPEDMVATSAARAGANLERVVCLATKEFEEADEYARALRPRVIVFDSIQMLVLPHLRFHAAAVEITKRAGILAGELAAVVWLICHVTKDNTAAGPNTLKHYVDTLVHLGRDKHGARYVESTKNRFGPTPARELDPS